MTTTSTNPSPRVPSLTLHKTTSREYVRLNGKCVYLGPFHKPETKQKCHVTIAEWQAGDKKLIPGATYEALSALDGLRIGRSEATETELSARLTLALRSATILSLK